MASSVSCPKCKAVLKLANQLAQGQKVKCPKCSALFAPDPTGDEEKPWWSGESAPMSLDDDEERPAPKRAAKQRDEDDEEERPARKSKSKAGREDEDDDRPRKSRSNKKQSQGNGLIIGVVVGVLGLLGGGGFAAWALLGKPDRNTAAVTPSGGGGEDSTQGNTQGNSSTRGSSTQSTAPSSRPVAAAQGGGTPQAGGATPSKPKNNTPQGGDKPNNNTQATNTPGNSSPQPTPAKPNPPRPGPPAKKDPPRTEPAELPRPVQDVTGLDPDALEKVRKATVMIRVEIGKKTGSGSGFIVKSSGDTAYLVTSFHVIAMKADEPEKPAYRDPRFMAFRRPEPKKEEKKVSVVLNCGAPEEVAVSAELAGIDADADLAILRVTGLRNLPAAIDLDRASPLSETMPAYIFGFPGGDKSISTSKGVISQLRKDDNNEIDEVQINGQMNPGNSGGPIVDPDGRLVGVAVAGVRTKNVGFAIPVGKVKHLLAGRIFYSEVMQAKQQGNKIDLNKEFWLFDGSNKIRLRDKLQDSIQVSGRLDIPPGTYFFVAQLSDPMHRIKTVGVQYCLAPDGVIEPDAKGLWTPLNKAAKVPLKIEDQDMAFGSFKLAAGSVPDNTYAFQVYYTNTDGQTIYTEPHPVRLTFPKNLKSLTLKVSVPADEQVRRFISDTIAKTFKGTGTRIVRTPYGMQVELDPVDEPKTAIDKITFGEVTATEGRTVSVKVTKVELPLPSAELAAKAVEDLKSGDNNRRKAACDWLGKVYRPLPEKQAEIAKLLEPLASEKDFWFRLSVLGALSIWVTAENAPGLSKLLEDDKYPNRGEVLRMVARFKDPATAPGLARLLPTWERGGASAALKAIGPAAEKAVIPYISHKDGSAALEACNILKEIGTAESAAALNEFLKTNPGATVKNAAIEAIKAIEARKK